MPFKKGDPQSLAWASSGGKARSENYRKNLEWMFGKGKEDLEEYGEKMDKLKSGGNLTESEKLWMEKVEKNLEFKFPKLARTESKIKNNVKMGVTLIVNKEEDIKNLKELVEE